MKKTLFKSHMIPPLELTDYIVLNYCLLDTTAEDDFIRVTSLRDRRLTAPNITAQLNQCREKKKKKKKKNMSTSTMKRQKLA